MGIARELAELGSSYNSGGVNQIRNRIINGAMVISQRNGTSSFTPANGDYTLDRWIYQAYQAGKVTCQQNAGSVTPPVGFTNYLGYTSTSAYTVGSGEAFWTSQRIEGFNIADLGWGTANAKTVTFSFWVRSSLTGTFGGAIGNSAGTQSYPFGYTISSANTWEQKTITVAGSTTGSWPTDNSIGLLCAFSLGAGSTFSGTAGAWTGSQILSVTGATSVVGTNGATFYITGVDLRLGEYATAPSPDFRSYQQELALCQRYYFKITGGASSSCPFGVGFIDTSTTAVISTSFPVEMRTDPTSLEQNGTAGNYRIRRAGTAVNCSAVPTFFASTKSSAASTFTVGSAQTTGQSCFGGNTTSNTGFLAWSAEL